MGIVRRDGIIPIAYKPVYHDVLNRSEISSTDMAFSPYVGCYEVFKSQGVGGQFSNITPNDIANYLENTFGPYSSKRQLDVSDDLNGIQIDSEYTSTKIKSDISMLIANIKQHKEFKKLQRVDEQYAMSDEESGEVSIASDYSITSIHTEDVSNDIKDRIVYILSKFQDGSETHKFSILSFAIKKAYLLKLCDNTRQEFKVSEYVDGAKKVYKYNYNEIAGVDEFVPYTETDKTIASSNSKYRLTITEIIRWLTGEIDNPYYSLIDELISLCNKIGVSLADEDCTKYTKDVVDSFICTYLVPNSDILTSYMYSKEGSSIRHEVKSSMFDKITVASLFTVDTSNKFEESSLHITRQSVKIAAERSGILYNEYSFLYKTYNWNVDGSMFNDFFSRLYNDVNAVDSFISLDGIISKGSKPELISIDNICSVFGIKTFPFMYNGVSKLAGRYAICTDNGLLIKVDDYTTKDVKVFQCVAIAAFYLCDSITELHKYVGSFVV